MLQIVEDESGKTRRFWQPPQILPFRRLANFDGDLYGHSNGVPETYKAFDGTNDNGGSMLARAKFAYRNFGKWLVYKRFNLMGVIGYIASNTTLTVKSLYNFDGFTQTLEKDIVGTDEDILFQPLESGSLGDNPLGDAPLGDQPNAVSSLPRFITELSFLGKDFFELQTIFETNDTDQQWILSAFGPQIMESLQKPIKIKK